MPARVTGSVHCPQLKLRVTVERDDLAVFDISIDFIENLRGLFVRRYGNVAAEMRLQCIHSANVIRMMVRENDLAHLPARGNHLVNAFGKGLLLVFIR